VHRKFKGFLDSVEPCIRELHQPSQFVEAIAPHLRDLVREPDWLELPYRRSIASKPYAQYLLHRPADHAFSVVSFVWNPGQGSPIHDHCTWGIIGQLEGEEEERRFRITDKCLESVSVARALPGDVSHVYPPKRDIHQIMNRTDKPTISIHIYGGDIGSQRRHVYDPVTGEKREFISGYDDIYTGNSRLLTSMRSATSYDCS
jgi:predicted metal-dependent enzyme (double-stranded beta helix superfamily)